MEVFRQKLNLHTMGKRETPKYDLEERLIEFAVRIIDAAESLPKTLLGK